MIVYDLQCGDGGERFEAWFSSSGEFDEQQAAGLVECPYCRSANVTKAPMAPRVPRKRAEDAFQRIAAAQAELLKGSRWVGDQFADTARAIHSGELAPEPVHGSATLDQARSLVEDGVPVAPLPLPVTPPKQLN